jgi:hypothetical protein
MRRIVAAVALSFAATTAAAPQDEIASLLNEFLAKVDDIAMHERFWADDLVYVSAKGEVRSPTSPGRRTPHKRYTSARSAPASRCSTSASSSTSVTRRTIFATAARS